MELNGQYHRLQEIGETKINLLTPAVKNNQDKDISKKNGDREHFLYYFIFFPGAAKIRPTCAISMAVIF